MAEDGGAVSVRRERVVLPTYAPCPADPHPQFIEKRVYQGSSGKVYPLPFTDRIEEQKQEREWDGVWLENEYVRLLVLPQLGGRIHVGQDKTNGYDFFYRQDVIKPALVGLAGPWISGGVEFNWPQHHRPSTFMPCDVHIERDEASGAVTVWCSEHEPMNRMKGMHGVCLRPGSSLVELRVRLYNRTQLTQTFLWWANVAVRVNDQYQSFFPPDVRYVADHAKRAMSSFPECTGHYYGVDYRPGTRLDWYRNIPVPTSYMICNTDKDFFGGYDHGARGGVVHVASHHIAPGKKQWTWGNHEFGYAWDRNLTDEGGPYIELMAGVYTDNQPDFSFLAPLETKIFSQHWFPIRDIGCAQHANLHGALSLEVEEGGAAARVGVAATAEHPAACVTLLRQGQQKPLLRETTHLGPGRPYVRSVPLPPGCAAEELLLRVEEEEGGWELLAYRPEPPPEEAAVPDPATEPPPPEDVAGNDELYLTGLHLEQYRHPTRDPCAYWQEALRRDPGDCRCNAALGAWSLRRGEFRQAEAHLRAATARLTARNPNPADGEPLYLLGLTLRALGRDADAYAAFYKATWNYAWRSAGHYALAQVDSARGDWAAAATHARAALATNADCLQARNLLAAVLRRSGEEGEAAGVVAATRQLDPLDWWAAHLEGGGAAPTCDTQTALDVALDYAGAGLYDEALSVLEAHAARPSPGTAPLLHYYRAFFLHKQGRAEEERSALAAAAAAPPDYVFPARLQEIAILQHAVEQAPEDARVRYYLGCLLYDRRRYDEAVALWEAAVALQPESLPSAWRNLGIAYFNVKQDPQRAVKAYDRAVALAPGDSRLLYERDQLAKRTAVPPERRLAALEERMGLVRGRDALAVEAAALYCQLGRPEAAAQLLASRRFQPWEGGEGEALAQHVRCHLALARAALAAGDAREAVRLCEEAVACPHRLGEARHLLANDSEARYWLGRALEAAGRQAEARQQWEAAAAFQGDFQGMAVCAFSEQSLHSALSLRALGREQEARELLSALLGYARRLRTAPASIDYFATSLPTMLTFHDDLQQRQDTKALFLEAQALWGLGEAEAAAALLARVLARDPAHAQAADLAGEMEAAGQSLPEVEGS